MGLYKTISVNKYTKVLIWKTEETFEELYGGIYLKPESKTRLERMRSDLHQKGFLSVRHLLKEVDYTDDDLYYDKFNKPLLKDGKFISITHSFIFAAIIISDKHPVGIDIEKQRDKIVKIAHKFTPIEEYKSITNHNALVSKLTIVWGAKESLYKIYGKKKLLFLEHIFIKDFSFENNKTTGQIRYQNQISNYQVFFFEMEGFTCVYAY